MGAGASKGAEDFGKGFVNTLSGAVNVVTAPFGIPEIPLIDKNDPSLFGHSNQNAQTQAENARANAEAQRQQALQQIGTINIAPITIPDIKPTGAGASQNFSLPPPIQVKGSYVDKAQLQKAQEEAVLQQQILLGAIGVGGLTALYLLKKA
jgi:hypothetical protein